MIMSIRNRTIEVDINLDDFDDSDIIGELISRVTLWKHKPKERDLDELRKALFDKKAVSVTMDEQRFYELITRLSKIYSWNQLINKLEN